MHSGTKIRTAISINAKKWDDFLASMEWFRETNRSKVIEETMEAFTEMANHAKKQDIKRMPRLVFKTFD